MVLSNTMTTFAFDRSAAPIGSKPCSSNSCFARKLAWLESHAALRGSNAKFLRIKNKRALSLTELLVSSVLIGIVMVGVAAFILATKQMRDSTSRATVLSIQTAAALNFIATDAMKAAGDNDNRGVVTGSQATRRSICFRHDVNDPASYADDTWQCYFSDSSQLYRCTEPTAGVPPAPTNFNSDCDQGNGAVFLAQLSQTDFATVVDDAVTGRFQYVSISLNTIYDDTAAADPIQNPTYTLSTRVSPPGHGR